jgi:gluconokinase
VIIFLFGLPGAGKSYIGHLLRQRANIHFWEGDEALSHDMREAVNQEQPFSPAMMEKLTSSIIQQILTLKKQHALLVISQAMLIEADRNKISACVGDILYVYVHCPLPLMRERVKRRGDFVTESYLEKLMVAFEKHKAEAECYPSIENAGKTDEQIVDEIVKLVNIKTVPSNLDNEEMASTSFTNKC